MASTFRLPRGEAVHAEKPLQLGSLPSSNVVASSICTIHSTAYYTEILLSTHLWTRFMNLLSYFNAFHYVSVI